METNNTQNKKGFTLVEIAIVLVIIGLLLGGVLKGQELITNAKIRAVTGDLEGISAAYYAFQDRTGLIPGDSNNDGIIDGKANFWNDLRREGFISGAVTASGTAATGPRHDLDGVFTAGNELIFGLENNFICASNIEESVAQGMDTKLDDGVSNTGAIRGGTTGSAPATAVFTIVHPAYNPVAIATILVCKEL